MRDTDDILIADARRGLAEGRFDAFERLILNYEKLIYSIAYRYFNNPEDARDMSQEAIIKIYQGLPRLTDLSGSFKGWICAVTANTCLDELRKRRSKIAQALPDNAISPLPQPEDTVMAQETVSEMLTAIETLSDDHKTLIILRDMNGLNYQELAEATGVPVNTVKSRLSRARTILREKLRAFV